MEGLLTKPTKYNIEDSNIALLGSDLEKTVREHAGDKEPAWEGAGKEPGVKIWRIEKFHVVDWPKEKYGRFYDGDSYIVLHTYKKSKDSDELAHDLHFWIGEESSQDEAATAAYKTVELDDHLNGLPVEYRELQSHESPQFLSYFPHKFLLQRGGVATGFHHVSSPPPDTTRRLYRVTNLTIREVSAEGSNVVQGDAYVLDMGKHVWQFNAKGSVGKERFRAAEFVRELVEGRMGGAEVTVFDQGTTGASKFLSELGLDAIPAASTATLSTSPRLLFRLSDASGTPIFTSITPPTRSSLSSSDAFLLDDTPSPTHPAVYVWIGSDASLGERRLALEYAQRYLHSRGGGNVRTSLVKMVEGRETGAFERAIAE